MRAASTGGLRQTEAYRERAGHENSRFGTRSRPNRRLAWWFKGRRDAVSNGTLREWMQAAPDPYPRALPDDAPNGAWMQEYTVQQRAKIDTILKRSHVTCISRLCVSNRFGARAKKSARHVLGAQGRGSCW